LGAEEERKHERLGRRKRISKRHKPAKKSAPRNPKKGRLREKRVPKSEQERYEGGGKVSKENAGRGPLKSGKELVLYPAARATRKSWRNKTLEPCLSCGEPLVQGGFTCETGKKITGKGRPVKDSGKKILGTGMTRYRREKRSGKLCLRGEK